MKRFINFIIGKFSKKNIPLANLDNYYPPIKCEETSLKVETLSAEVMISKYIPEEVCKKEVIHKLGDGLTEYVTFETIADPYLPDRFRCRATIRIVKER